MKVLKEAKLIMSDVGANNNKYYYLWLYEDGTIESENGRVGVTSVKNQLPKLHGESDFDKQVKSKIKKGYTELKTVSTTAVSGSKTVGNSDLKLIASKQIKTDKPELQKLIDRLVTANIHKITSSTNITYNDTTGLFSTPLGVVDLSAINDARDLLVVITDFVKSRDYSNRKLIDAVNKYLRLVPQNVGMRLNIENLFPDDAAAQKQLDLLDSLEASYKALRSAPPKADGKQVVEEKVFDVELGIIDPKDTEYNRISDYYYKTRKSHHGYDNVTIKGIYKVAIAEMAAKFNSKLPPIKEVFHGTSQANLLSILKSGLKISPPSSAHIAGKMFGNGIYGAINSSKSLGYTYGRWGGTSGDSGWLFICDFAMGKTYHPTYTGNPPSGYDSVWARERDCGLRHDELIVYRDSQVNIKYLIECK